ncbi:MAG: NfeD family protein [Desulfopila sp.]
MLSSGPSLTAGQPVAVLLELQGAVGPAASDYLQRGFERAEQLQSAVIIVRIDTPGGLDYAMRQIVQRILASDIPVIGYVAPAGARAASAGTYILYACHLAAMAPATNLGAATPVRLGGWPEMPAPEETSQEPAATGKANTTTLERKMIHDASAYIKGLAERHGRNSQWAVRAVRESVSLSAEEALALGVVDIVAGDLTDLLDQADGRSVQLASGPRILASEGLSVVSIEPTLRTRLLAVIGDPNVAYMLMLLGIYGLLFELANPGFFLPGVVGVISLCLAFYGLQILPVNFSGLALIFLGMALLAAELFVPSFGSLGIGGISAFVVGSLMLIDDQHQQVSRPMIAVTALGSAGFLFWLVGRYLGLRQRKNETGPEAMIGAIGEAAVDFTSEGWVWVAGESWRGRCATPVRKGERVRIVGQDGLCLIVSKYHKEVAK